MSFTSCPDPDLGDRVASDAVELLVIPRAVDLGEMTVRRALPLLKRQMVGPFILKLGRLFRLMIVMVDDRYDERALYTLSGTIEIGSDSFNPAQLIIIKRGAYTVIKTSSDARFMLLGAILWKVLAICGGTLFPLDYVALS